MNDLHTDDDEIFYNLPEPDERVMQMLPLEAYGGGPPHNDGAGGWESEPQPLLAKIDPKPYPVDALPPMIRAAVKEVASYVMAPLPMVAASALATLSLASQAYVDVKRREKLQGPVGLFFLTIADSGERKSTCDSFFSKSITEYERVQREAAQADLMKYRADLDVWEAKHNGTKDKIRHQAKQQKPTSDLETLLHEMEGEKPVPPKFPRLIYGDATPEALAHGLAKNWPSGGVMSAEAGLVLGSHGMGSDSIMRNLSQLNLLWDGDPLTFDRKTSECFVVQGARLTIGLQVQRPVMLEFLQKSGQLARGSGFLARFLVAWPVSTQGTRFIDPAAPDGPANWPALDAYHQRIRAILGQPAPIDEAGALQPTVLSLSSDAMGIWVEFFNEVEAELRSGGRLEEVREIANKAAGNVARLAALFQMAEGPACIINAESMQGACRVVGWHLREARRFYGEIALPADMVDAVKLDRWLIEYCTRENTTAVPSREAQRHAGVRDRKRLDAALEVLVELDRVSLAKDGRKKFIWINPALLVTQQ